MHFVDGLSVHFLMVVETAAIAAMRKEMDKIEMLGTIVIDSPGVIPVTLN